MPDASRGRRVGDGPPGRSHSPAPRRVGQQAAALAPLPGSDYMNPLAGPDRGEPPWRAPAAADRRGPSNPGHWKRSRRCRDALEKQFEGPPASCFAIRVTGRLPDKPPNVHAGGVGHGHVCQPTGSPDCRARTGDPVTANRQIGPPVAARTPTAIDRATLRAHGPCAASWSAGR